MLLLKLGGCQGTWLPPHLKGSSTIMASSFERSRCIDSLTISAFNVLERDPQHEANTVFPASFTYRRTTHRASRSGSIPTEIKKTAP
jgi:hypothetical protein